MASALASQLQQLAKLRQPALPAALKKGKPSLLFDYQKAADVDVQTIYDLSCQGLEELVRLEPRFRPYRESLFSRGSLEINPDMQTTEFLAKLDESIHGFCCLLTNHFLSPPAFKVLEYLIRRYKANERNVDSLMTAALPYHSTNEFVRLAQTLALGPAGSLWGWLAKMQSSGASLPRDRLAQRCVNDRQLLLFICRAAGQLGGAPSAAAASDKAPALRPSSRTFLSFYAVLLCEVLAILPSVSEEFLAAVLPHLLEGLGAGAAQDYRAATLMAVAELCSRATLGRDFIKVLLGCMLKHTEPLPEHIRTALLVMAHVAVTQPHVRTLSDKTLKHLLALPNMMSELSALSKRGNIRLGPLLALLCRSLVAALAAASAPATPGGATPGGSAGRKAEGELLALAHSGALEGEPARALAAALLEAGGAANAAASLRKSCQKVLRVLDQRYPETTDGAVNAFLEPLREHRRQAAADAAAAGGAADADGKRKRRKTGADGKADSKSIKSQGSDDEASDDDTTAVESAEAAAAGLSPEDGQRFEFVRATFAAGGYSAPCGGTMLTLAAALTAPQAAVRRMALQQLDADLAAAAPDADGTDAAVEARGALTSAALARLRDDDLGVVVAALGLDCLRRLPPAALLDALAPLTARLGEYLYGSARLPQLKAARKAARKAAALLRAAGGADTATAAQRDAAALQLLGLMLPTRRDPRVAVEAAKAASELGAPLFAHLAAALPQLEAALSGGGQAAPEAKAKKGAKKGKEEAKEEESGGGKADKKAAQAAAAAAVGRGVVAALAKAVAAEPEARGADAMRLVEASAAVGAAADGAAASMRAQHLLLLAANAAAATGGAAKPAKGAAAASATALPRVAVRLAETLLPYARLPADGDTAAAAERLPLTTFAELVSAADGLPTAAHNNALQSDPAAAHGALVLGSLQANLARLPEPAAAAADDAAAASRLLAQLASLGYLQANLGDLGQLVVTRSIPAADRAAFLAGIYAAPSAAAGAAGGAAAQCLALGVQAQLAEAAAAAGGRHATADVGGWLATLLAAAASHDASSVRGAAADCLAAVAALLEAGKASAGPQLSPKTAAALCSALAAQRKLLRRDADAAASLLRGALLGASATAAAAPPPTPSRGRKVAAAAKAVADGASGPPPTLELPAGGAAEVATFLVGSLAALDADAAGANTACVLLACLTDSSPSRSAAAAGSVVNGAALFASAATLLGKISARLRQQPASATPQDALAITSLLRLFTSVAASAAAASGHADRLSRLAEAAELLPPPPPSSVSPAAVASLATARLAAVSAVTPELFAALPPTGGNVREIFAVLLTRYEGDPDEAVRAASRSALETLPLSAELILPLLNPSAAAVATDAAASQTPKKKSKKADGAAATPAPATAAAAAGAPPPPPDAAALRSAVSALELLQWRSGIAHRELLPPALEALLRRLLPIVGSIASSSATEDEPEAEEPAAAADGAAADAAATSALAGYAATLALTALAGLAAPADMDGGEGRRLAEGMDLALAVQAAREAPDAAVRNAALALLASLAQQVPEAALSHVLQVLAVVHQSAAVADDAHSRAVGATALASVVPAWVAAGRRPAALWEQVAAALPSLPPHRRLELLLGLMRALPQVEDGLSDGLLVLLQHASTPEAQAPPKQATPPPAPAPAKTPAKSAKKAKAAEPAPEPAPAAPVVPAGPPPAEWLPELAGQLVLQVELPVRLACCARLLELALAASKQQPHTALPRIAVAFVTAQLKLKVAVSAAGASHRRPEADPALEAGCRRLMASALSHMQLLQPDSVASGAGSGGHGSPAASSRLHRAVLASSRGLYALFAALQGVMAADAYLQALLTLAEHPSDKVKRRALKLFTDKVRGVRAEVADRVELPQRVRDAQLRQAGEAAARACAMLPPLLATPGAASADSGASPLTRQLALIALAAIAAEFGASQHAALLAGVPAVLAATRDGHAAIRSSALACVAALVAALGQRLVPVLPSTVAAAVAAADRAWARLARAGTPAAAAPAAADAEMRDADAELSESDEEEEEGSDAAEGGGGAGRRRARGRGPRSDSDDAALELSSALACLNALVETLGGFLSPHLPQVLAILLNPRVLACRVAACDQFAASIRSRLPTAVPARLLLPALYERLQPCIDAAADAADGPSAAAPAAALLTMVGAAAASLEPKLAVQYHEHMFAFLLRALDVRQRRPPPLAAHGDAAIDIVEAAAIAALVSLVMKLSESKFKPMFLRLLEWASTVSVPEGLAGAEPSYMGRMVTLFGAVNALCDRLRSVLVPYYRYLLDAALQHLGSDDGGRPRGKKKLRRSAAAAAAAADADADPNSAEAVQARLAWLLRLRIVRALHRGFLHDSVGFVDAERFARLQAPLIAQLECEPPEAALACLRSPAHADRDLTSYVALGAATRAYTAADGDASAGPLPAAAIGCLLAMAVAANTDALWKPLNHAALMLTRAGSPRVRALGLELAAQLVERLREEYLVLLPEALPFLAEALEDADAGVAARVRQVVAQLEEISGEKLDEYLKV
ncbi:hypothetical protein HYH03_014807 [Edaphochlamys debaryana]|uniref:BP28 C-terminal domain-containing protein n=1 Tax=Edaphochlamys debaryana TaxID=47281 RepID=A0A836BRT2_9CHLO|nr:hypothetical protein HYH03_014807 [Edaphochlamys debaryana]|eukprot:KAG2486505.1 hypothetical protein HYH03_014807 [Edaphochlamys debaryana]